MDTHIKGIAVKATTRKTNKQKKQLNKNKEDKNGKGFCLLKTMDN